MAKNPPVEIGPLREDELEEAGRVVRLAFGTFLGLPNPMEFMGDRDFVSPRFHSRNAAVLAARDASRLIGLNVATRWGSFGFFGPLTVLPEYWNRSVAHQLLAATMKVFDRWGIRHTGLFTFANSAKHVGLYQKFGYWPGYLTAIMKRTPVEPASSAPKGTAAPVLLTSLTRAAREQAIEDCARLTNRIKQGLDLSDEIRAVAAQFTGDIILIRGARTLDAFAVCMHGAGSEGGGKTCYVKFAAARDSEPFGRLLDAIDAFALARGAEVETGVSTACADAFRRMRSYGYRPVTLGVAMQRPHVHGFNRPAHYVLGDWR
ncbi:MAG: GNAT family N-acetyltransferase [Terracidiphilus sp.]|jgi:GNAT superfamily N-acetyltransferase